MKKLIRGTLVEGEALIAAVEKQLAAQQYKRDHPDPPRYCSECNCRIDNLRATAMVCSQKCLNAKNKPIYTKNTQGHVEESSPASLLTPEREAQRNFFAQGSFESEYRGCVMRHLNFTDDLWVRRSDWWAP